MKPQHWISTDVGAVRTHNEDAFLWMSPEDTHDHGYLWLIADGMGGEAAGERASHTVIQTVREVYPVAMEKRKDPYAAIEISLQAANRRIKKIQEREPELHRMGTTAVCMVYYGDRAYISHVGDSRCYVWFSDELRQITKDHTKLQMLLDAGAVDEQDIEDHPSSHILTNAIGREEMFVDHNGKTPIRIDNKVFLLCSDGLSGYVDEPMLIEAVDRLYARDATEGLLELARHNQAQDNASASVIRFSEPSPTILTDKDAFLQWADENQRHQEHIEPTAKNRPEVFPRNDKDPAPTSVEELLQSVRKKDKEGSEPEKQTGRLVGRKPMTSRQGMVPAGGSHPPTTVPDTPVQDDVAEESSDLRDGDSIKVSESSSNRYTSTKGLPTGRSRRSPKTTPTPSVKTVSRQREKASEKKPTPQADTHIHSREIAAISPEQSEAPAASSSSSVSEVNDSEPESWRNQRKSMWLLVGVLTIVFIGLIATILIRHSNLRDSSDTARTSESSTEDDPTSSEPGEKPPEIAKPSSDIEHTKVPPPLTPLKPSSPNLIVTEDQMPMYRVEGRDEETLYVDAHEVTYLQFQEVLASDEVLRTLHENIDTPRYEELPCFVDMSSPSEAKSKLEQPVCVSVESAERYCHEVGRSLPTRSDWEFLMQHGSSHISAGNGLLHMFSRDRSALPVDSTSIDGIYGVFDGYPEILARTDLDDARGDIPVLGTSSRAERQYEVGQKITRNRPPISVQQRLETKFQTQDLTRESRPQLGFRCVATEEEITRIDTVEAASNPPKSEPKQQPDLRRKPIQPSADSVRSRQRKGRENTSKKSPGTPSRVIAIEPYPDRRRRGGNAGSESSSGDTGADTSSSGVLHNIEEQLNEN